ncbi:hypothetical protein [Candidatus Darwinibacter acetoxidans]
MQQSTEKIRSWFDRHRQKELRIRKEEDDDLDEARIRLEDVEVVQHHDTDGYLSSQAVLLKGEGTVVAAHGEEPLPGRTFEISLTDRWFSAADDCSLHLNTVRGSYHIEIINSKQSNPDW